MGCCGFCVYGLAFDYLLVIDYIKIVFDEDPYTIIDYCLSPDRCVFQISIAEKTSSPRRQDYRVAGKHVYKFRAEEYRRRQGTDGESLIHLETVKVQPVRGGDSKPKGKDSELPFQV